MTLKVAHVTPNFYPYVTGVANEAFNISRSLVKKGINVCIFTSDFKAESSQKRETIDGVEIIRLPISRKFMQYFVTPTFQDRLQEFKPDIVHAHCYRSYQTQSAHNYCRRNLVPLVISMHGTAVGYKFMRTGLVGRIPYFVYDKLWGREQLLDASALVVNSSKEKSEVANFTRNGNIFRIPMGYKTSFADRAKTNRILLVERITYDRDPRPLIRAIKRVKSSFPDVCFRIVGNEVVNSSSVKKRVLQSSKDLVKELDLTDNVFFPGYLYGDSLENEYRSAEIFLYNSRYENFGQPILEAASHGLPPITTNVGIVNDLVENGVNGFVINTVDDTDAFAEKISLLLSNPWLRRDMSRRIMEKIEREFSVEYVTSRYISMYQDLR